MAQYSCREGVVTVNDNISTETGAHIVPIYEPIVKALLHRAWERLGRQTNTALKQANARRDKYKETWKGELEVSHQHVRTWLTTNVGRSLITPPLPEADLHPTPGNLRQASRALRDYRDLAKITGEADGREFRELDKKLADLWADLGYTRDKEGSGECKKSKPSARLVVELLPLMGVVSKVKAKRNMALATEEDMHRAYEAYIELHFPTDEDAIAEITHRLEEASATKGEVSLNLVEGVTDEDLGVAEFAHVPSQEILSLLGLAQGKSLPFASDKMEMKWHQLVGIAAMIKAMFTPMLAMPPRPTLLCDDVGLGKTVQIIGTISMLVHLIEIEQPSKTQTGSTPWPPLIADSGNLFFAGRDKIPRLPMIIVAPRTLIRQWHSQIMRFTTPNAFRVVIYPSEQSERKQFWAKGGIYAKAVEKAKHPHRTIILVATSTILQESAEFLPKLPETRDGKRMLCRGDVPGVLASKDPSFTLFSRDYLLFVLDESHSLRNANKSQQGAMTLAARSVVRIGASATPVFTSAKDLAAQGKLLRYKPMIGDEGYDLGMDMLRLERQRAKEWKEGGDKLIAGISSRLSSHMVGATEADEEEQNVDTQRQMVGEYMANQDSQGYRNYYINQVAIDKLRSLLLPIVIRRTGASRDPNGKTVLNLNPYVESVVWIRLREDESQAIKELFEEMISNRDQEGGREIRLLVWKNFLMDHKSVLFHSRLAKSASNHGSEDFWKNWTADDLPQLASSKIMGALGIIEHYDDPNACPLYFKRDGTRDLQKEEAHASRSGNDPSEKPRKVLMFIMYEVHRDIIKTVLSLKGRRCLVYDGNMSTRVREQVVAQFEKDEDVRVMLISNVGTTGLNLTMASVVIFVSGLWSGLETMQTIGRCWRQGQTRIVHVYHIIVPDTVDEMLCGYANGKLLMWEYFLRRDELISKLFESSDRDSQTQHDDTEDEAPTLKTKSHARGRALKAANSPEDSSLENGVKSGSKRKAETSSGKRKKARTSTQLDGSVEKNTTEDIAPLAERITIARKPDAFPSPSSMAQAVTTIMDEASTERPQINDPLPGASKASIPQRSTSPRPCDTDAGSSLLYTPVETFIAKNQGEADKPDDAIPDLPSISSDTPIQEVLYDVDVAAMPTKPVESGLNRVPHAVEQAVLLHAATSHGCSEGFMTTTSSPHEMSNPSIASSDAETSCSYPSKAVPTTSVQCEDAFMRDLLSDMDELGKTGSSLPARGPNADPTLAVIANTGSTIDKRDDRTDSRVQDIGKPQTFYQKGVETSGSQQSGKHIAAQLQPSPLIKRPVISKTPVLSKRPIVLHSRPTGSTAPTMSQAKEPSSRFGEPSRSGIGLPAVPTVGSPMDQSVSATGLSKQAPGQFKKNLGQSSGSNGKGKAVTIGTSARPASGSLVRMRSPPRNAKPGTGRTVNLDLSVLHTRGKQSGKKD
ncbi:hypothetical protein FS749_008706 [Ceratobasidium sp. UAMH 11750]|nr:hypothetical protein FS749_008706 [Ceratobasidium sp. UAMH 11750]